MMIFFFSFILCQLTFASVKVILTSPLEPMVYCTIGDDTQSTFSGLDISKFDLIATEIGWKREEYIYQCINFTDLQNLITDTSKYVGFVGGITIDSAKEQKGFVFSYPMWNTGASIILYDYLEFWFQVRVLTGEVCSSLIGAALGIGILQYFFEKREQSLEQFLWNSMTSMFFITTINLKRTASRVLQLFFWFMIFIISSTYIARATNMLTIDRSLYQIKTPYDLNHKRVITYSVYKYELLLYGAIPLTSDFGTKNNYQDSISIELIKNDLSREDDYKVDAFVIDDVQASIAEYTECKLYISSRQFYQFSYGFAFHKTQSSSLISQINSAILQITLNEESSEDIIMKFISDNYKQCKKGSTEDTITMNYVGGLFVIQGIAIGISLFMFCVTKVPLYRRLQKKLIQLNILSEEVKEDEKELQGDELIVVNIKSAAKEQISRFQNLIEDRLDEMDENIVKFYEILLNEDQLKKNKIITEPENYHPSFKNQENLHQSQIIFAKPQKEEQNKVFSQNNLKSASNIQHQQQQQPLHDHKKIKDQNNISKEIELIDFGDVSQLDITTHKSNNQITPGNTSRRKEENSIDNHNQNNHNDYNNKNGNNKGGSKK